MSNKYSTSKYERGQLMDKKDYYKILGLKEDANQIEIYNAYFNLAKIHHPDKGGTNEKMAKINLAFKELFDRKKYNELRLKKGISSYSTNNQAYNQSASIKVAYTFEYGKKVTRSYIYNSIGSESAILRGKL